MSRPLPFALLSIAAMLLGVAFAQAATADGGDAAGSIVKAPRIKSGRYGSGDVYMEVNVKRRKVSLRFTLYCDDIYADQYVSTGLKPSNGTLDGNRVGAKAFVFGMYSGAAASGPGTQVADWTLNGKFTPAHAFRRQDRIRGGDLPGTDHRPAPVPRLKAAQPRPAAAGLTTAFRPGPEP